MERVSFDFSNPKGEMDTHVVCKSSKNSLYFDSVVWVGFSDFLLESGFSEER